MLATELAKPTEIISTPTLTRPSQTPTSTNTPAVPGFSSLRFSTQADGIKTQKFFVAGTPRIYALWDYSNILPGMTVRRVWSRDGIEWIRREEPWDYEKYGANGTIRDISIFDEETGLESGKYSLSLYLFGENKNLPENQALQETNSIRIFPPDISTPISSPDKSHTAYINLGGRLTIEDPQGEMNELVVTQEISDLAWFPDNQHLIYADRDRTNQVNESSDIGITHKLWILDIVTGNRILVSSAEDNFHTPVVSPDGKMVAVLTGSSMREACQASPTLSILELDNNFRVRKTYTIDDFTGLTVDTQSGGMIVPHNPQSPGDWQRNNQLVVPLTWTCVDQQNAPDGLYLLDFTTMNARRIGDIP